MIYFIPVLIVSIFIIGPRTNNSTKTEEAQKAEVEYQINEVPPEAVYYFLKKQQRPNGLESDGLSLPLGERPEFDWRFPHP